MKYYLVFSLFTVPIHTRVQGARSLPRACALSIKLIISGSPFIPGDEILQRVAQYEEICCVTSCEFDEKRATKPNLLPNKVDLRSTFRKNFLQPETNVTQQVDHTR